MKLGIEKMVLAAFGLSGMAALIYEVVWTRLLVLIFGSTVYAVSAMLSAFMAGLALGSFLIAKYSHKISNPVRFFAYLELGIGFYGILFILLMNLMQYPFFAAYTAFKSSFWLFSLAEFGLIFLALLIPTTLMGATFPIVSRIFVKTSDGIAKDVGYVYSINSLGSVVGPFAAGFILIPLIGVRNTSFLASLINILIAAAILLYYGGVSKKTVLAFLITLLAIFPASQAQLNVMNFYHMSSFNDFESMEKSLADREVLFSKDGAYSTVQVTRSRELGQLTLRIDGRADAGTGRDMRNQLLSGYLPMLLHKNPKTVLNIGLGSGITLGAINNFNASVDVVEIDESVVEAAREYFSPYNNNALDSENVNLVVNDARNFLLLTDKKYDVITSEPSHPFTSSVNHLFTKEFFQLVKKHLNEGGLYAQWIPTHHNIQQDDYKIVLNTILSEFPYAAVWEPLRGETIVIASTTEYDYRIKEISSRVLEDLKRADLFSVEDVNSLLVLDISSAKSYVSGTTTFNTDDMPVIEFSAPRSYIEG